MWTEPSAITSSVCSSAVTRSAVRTGPPHLTRTPLVKVMRPVVKSCSSIPSPGKGSISRVGIFCARRAHGSVSEQRRTKIARSRVIGRGELNKSSANCQVGSGEILAGRSTEVLESRTPCRINAAFRFLPERCIYAAPKNFILRAFWHVNCEQKFRNTNIMAAKIRIMKLLQEMRGFAQVTNRLPPQRRPGLFLMQLRSHVGQTTRPIMKRVITVEVQEPQYVAEPVKITHLNANGVEAVTSSLES